MSEKPVCKQWQNKTGIFSLCLLGLGLDSVVRKRFNSRAQSKVSVHVAPAAAMKRDHLSSSGWCCSCRVCSHLHGFTLQTSALCSSPSTTENKRSSRDKCCGDVYEDERRAWGWKTCGPFISSIQDLKKKKRKDQQTHTVYPALAPIRSEL